MYILWIVMIREKPYKLAIVIEAAAAAAATCVTHKLSFTLHCIKRMILSISN